MLSHAIESIDTYDVHAYISYLASDPLYGRCAGTEENEKAVEWIADFMRKSGLKPGGDDESFFQCFDFRQRGTKGEKKVTRNVVAVWEGTDPVLKKEALVIGAHMDHVGRAGQESNPGRMGRATRKDVIWNGADDNASGTAAVMEVAQAFASLRLKTARTIVFILFNAEEHGLYGSEHYVAHPPLYPLDHTVAMINLDMIGRNNPGGTVSVLGADSSDKDYLMKLAQSSAARVGGLKLSFSNTFFGGSDHWPFLQKQIPIAFFSSGLHRDYHRISDHVTKIDCEQVRDVARTSMLMLYEMANHRGKVEFNSIYKPGIRSGKNRRLIGMDVGKRVTPEELEGLNLSQDQGAIRVAKVFKDTPADQAGLKKGDFILSIGTIRILEKQTVTCLRKAIDFAPAGVDVSLEVVRNGGIVLLTIRWPDE